MVRRTVIVALSGAAWQRGLCSTAAYVSSPLVGKGRLESLIAARCRSFGGKRTPSELLTRSDQVSGVLWISEPAGEVRDVCADKVPIAFSRQVLRLASPELGLTRYECSAESCPLREREIAVVGRREHDLPWIQPQDPRHVPIRLKSRFVRPGRVRTDDHGPGQLRP